jgi:hypothetical protein
MGKDESSGSSSDEDGPNMAALQSVAISFEQVVAESQSVAAKVRMHGWRAGWSIGRSHDHRVHAAGQERSSRASGSSGGEHGGQGPRSSDERSRGGRGRSAQRQQDE